MLWLRLNRSWADLLYIRNLLLFKHGWDSFFSSFFCRNFTSSPFHADHFVCYWWSTKRCFTLLITTINQSTHKLWEELAWLWLLLYVMSYSVHLALGNTTPNFPSCTLAPSLLPSLSNSEQFIPASAANLSLLPCLRIRRRLLASLNANFSSNVHLKGVCARLSALPSP